MSSLRQIICEKLCGHHRNDDSNPDAMPAELREVSHKIANRASEIQGVAQRLRNEVDALTQMAHEMQEHQRKRHD